MNFTAFPVIKTHRISLRQIEESDVDTIFFLRTNTIVNKYIERPVSRQIKSNDDALAFIQKINREMNENKSISWGICLSGETDIVGSICLWNFSEDRRNAEVGYDLNPKYHNKGIMSEALKEVVQFGFEQLDFHCISAYTHKENEGSKKLLEKCGFHANHNILDDENANNRIYEILKSKKKVVTE